MPYHLEIPDFGSLSSEQRRAVRHDGSIRLKGGPGTGKSLVSLWRALGEASGENVLILTYTLSLEFYFNKMLESARSKGNSKNIKIKRSQLSYYHASTMLSSHFDEIILDEAQDMKPEEISLFAQTAKRVSFGADYRQQLYPDKAASEQTLIDTLPVSRTFEMNRNYRSTQQILKAVRAFFPERSIPAEVIAGSSVGAPAQVYVCNHREEASATFSLLKEIILKTDGNIGVLVPSERKVQEVFETIQDSLPNDTTEYRSSTAGSSLNNMGRVHVSTYKSSKGLEWDVVILPYFGGRDWWISNTQVDLNDHYVAMRRAKNQLWLVSSNQGDKNILNSAYHV